MTKIQIHIHEVKQFIKNKSGLEEKEADNLLYLLTRLEETSPTERTEIADRMLSKKNYIDGIMATHFEGRIGRLSASEIRKRLEHCFDTGTLRGISVEHDRPYNVVVVIEGGTFSELWADRSGIRVHKFDIDDQAFDPVHYHKEIAEFDPTFNENEILKVLKSKFG